MLGTKVAYFFLHLFLSPYYISFCLIYIGAHQDPVEDGGDGEQQEGDEEVLVDVDSGDLEAPGDSTKMVDDGIYNKIYWKCSELDKQSL